ncbi:MAG: lipopolysaccharide biosynthesis protein [Leptospirillia bacterium]
MAGKVVTAVKWATLTTIASRLAPPLFTIFLARILAPDVFGLVAMAMVVVAFVTMFQDVGFRPALVQRKEISEELKNAVFWGTALFGAGFFLILYMLAPVAGQLYRTPEVVPVLRVLATLFLITPLGTVHGAMLTRALDFRRLFWIELIPALAPGVVSVSLALAGQGVWALVWGTLAGAVIRVFGLWRSVPWRPSGGPHFREWPRLLRFGGWVSLEAVLGWSITYFDFLFAGRYLGAVQVGYYRMGMSLIILPAGTVIRALNSVMFPAFSRVQNVRAQVREGFERAFRVVAVLVVPFGVGMFAFADPVVPLLIGEKWRPMVEVIEVLAPVGVMSALVNVAPPLYKAIGRVDIIPKFFLVRALVTIPVYWISARNGLMPLVWAKLWLTVGFAPINLWIATRVLGSRPMVLLRPVAVAVIVGLGAMWVAGAVGDGLPGLHVVLLTGIQLAVYAGVYVGVIYGMLPDIRKDAAEVIRGSRVRG